MSSYQPQPFRVIRDQLLAFLVLQLLGSCTPVTQLTAAPPTFTEVLVTTGGAPQQGQPRLQFGMHYQQSQDCL